MRPNLLGTKSTQSGVYLSETDLLDIGRAAMQPGPHCGGCCGSVVRLLQFTRALRDDLLYFESGLGASEEARLIRFAERERVAKMIESLLGGESSVIANQVRAMLDPEPRVYLEREGG